MGVRRRIATWLDVEGPLRARIAELEADLQGSRQEQAELALRLEKVEKRLGMAMGAIQAATAQIMGVKGAADEAAAEAKKALHQAHSALATAEAAVDGVAALEG
jgi:chromosome segregation ATPase